MQNNWWKGVVYAMKVVNVGVYLDKGTDEVSLSLSLIDIFINHPDNNLPYLGDSYMSVCNLVQLDFN